MTAEALKHHSITLSNGRRIAYVDEGQGNTILLLHGFCGSSLYWQFILPKIAPHYRVIAPDLRGHGQSDYGHGLNSIEQLADDAAHLITTLGIEHAIVIGHSLGGYIALALAERYPQLISGLSLVHSTAYPDSEEAKANRLKGMMNIRERGIRPYIEELIPKLFATTNLTAKATEVQAALEIGYKTDPEGAAQTLDAMRQRPDRNAVLEESIMPVLLIAGKGDQVIPPERTFSVERPNIQTRLIEDAGHMSMLESPDTLASILLTFAESINFDK